MNELTHTIRSALYGSGLARRGDRVAIAWSGGADSTFLTWAMRQLEISGDFKPWAIHIHHGLRPESDQEEELVRSVAKKLGVKLEVVHLDLTPGSGLQERARKARYSALEAVAARKKCNLILTGHTHDDQAETVLMRLIRGAHVRGLRGILTHTKRGWVRPMLGIRRQQLVRSLNEHDVPFILDPSNQDRQFLRIKVRKDLLPELERKLPDIRHRLVRISEEAQEVWARSEHLLESIRPGEALATDTLNELPDFLRGAGLEKWLDASLERLHVEQLTSMANGPTPQRQSAPGGHTIHRVGGHLVAGPRSGEPNLVDAFSSIIPLGSALETCPPPENYPPSSRWMPAKAATTLDTQKTKYVSEELRKNKIAPRLRPIWPVLVDDSCIIGIAGIDSTPQPCPHISHQPRVK